MKKQSVKNVKKDLDVLIDKIIKIRDKNTCQRCLKVVEGQNCHGSHVIPVSAGNKLRWDENNVKVLCFFCHLHFWHKNPVEAGDWFKKKFPERWAYLEATKGMVQMKYQDFVDLKKRLQFRLECLENGK